MYKIKQIKEYVLELWYEVLYRNWWSVFEIRHNIKWAYQRVVRGYDDKVMWGLDDYFEQIIPVLKEFCLDELNRTATLELNPHRCKIFKQTLKLIENYEERDEVEDWFKHPNNLSKLFEYVGRNVEFYWD